MNFDKYNYIDTIEKLRELDQFLMDGDAPRFNYMSLDLETNGLSLYTTTIVGFSIAINRNQGFYIPLLSWQPDEKSKKIKTINKVKYEVFEHGKLVSPWTGHSYEEFVQPHKVTVPEFIPILLKRWTDKVNLIFHNAPFDVNHIFINFKIETAHNVFLDTALLSHILNENSPNGLKETATEWKDELGINPYVMANQEQKELGMSVLKNGGKVSKAGKATSVWRADPIFMSKYACADAFLTFGLFEVGLEKFIKKFGPEKLEWLFETEIMPLCKEVVIPLKRNGVYIDVPYFKKMELETKTMMANLEDSIIKEITPHVADFPLGKSIDDSVSKQKLVKKIIEMEGLKVPTQLDKKTGKNKESLSKGSVKKEYEKNPHWIWGYILGEDEIKYSKSDIEKIKTDLYEESEGRRHRFNIGSDAHLRWLLCTKLGTDPKSLPQTDSATKDNPIPSMAAEVLEERFRDKYSFIASLLTFKKLRKLYSSYIMPAVELNIGGWLYMDMRQNGTTSGRFACSGGFNLQTLPKVEEDSGCTKCKHKELTYVQTTELTKNAHCSNCGHTQKNIMTPSAIKKGFIAPPGYKIINADYASLEPRCFAYESGDAQLKEVYWKGLDLYSKVYCDVFDDEKQYGSHPDDHNFLKKANNAARNMVKPIVLGIPYGARAAQVATLSEKTIKKVQKDGSIREMPDIEYGQWVIDKYLGKYVDLHKYMIRKETECVTRGFVESLIGRRRHFQYAPKIFKFLALKDLSPEDLIETSNHNLKMANISATSKNGHKLSFNDYELKTLIKDMGLQWEQCIKKDYWVYVKNLLKAELNNAKNFGIQSLAGHITNRGMLDTTRRFKENSVDGWVSLQIHDEVTCYAREHQSEVAAQCLKIGMEDNLFAKKIDIPMVAEPTICSTLKESK